MILDTRLSKAIEKHLNDNDEEINPLDEILRLIHENDELDEMNFEEGDLLGEEIDAFIDAVHDSDVHACRYKSCSIRFALGDRRSENAASVRNVRFGGDQFQISLRIFRAEDHAFAYDAAQFCGLQIGDHHHFFPDHLFGRIIFCDAADHRARFVADLYGRFEQFVRFFHLFRRQHFGNFQLYFGKILDAYHIVRIA